MANPIDKATGEGLQDRSAATIIVPPGGVPASAVPNVQAPAQPRNPIAAPAPAVVPAGGQVLATPGAPAVMPASGTSPVLTIPPVPLPPIHQVPKQ